MQVVDVWQRWTARAFPLAAKVAGRWLGGRILEGLVDGGVPTKRSPDLSLPVTTTSMSVVASPWIFSHSMRLR
jgi:hypothetical protein